jgi:hypothetical protein
MDDLLAASGGRPPAKTDKTIEDGGTGTTTEPSPDASLDGGEAEQFEEQTTEVDFETIKKRSAESIEDELKSLREEAKKRRLENKALKENALQLFEDERKQMTAKTKELEKQLKAFKELQLKAEAEKAGVEIDAKTQEILQAKELDLEQKQKDFEKLEKKHLEIESRYKEIIERQKEEAELKEKVLKAKIEAELETIPEDKRDFATALVRGYEDRQDGYFKLLEAKQGGLFGAKKVEVSHQVPKTDEGEGSGTKEQHRNNKERLSSGLSKVTADMMPGQRLV